MQTLTPHMQHVDTKLTKKEVVSASRISSSCDQEQGNLSLIIWKNAFRETCERLCPIRACGHECGCLPMLPRLVSLLTNHLTSYNILCAKRNKRF